MHQILLIILQKNLIHKLRITELEELTREYKVHHKQCIYK